MTTVYQTRTPWLKQTQPPSAGTVGWLKPGIDNAMQARVLDATQTTQVMVPRSQRLDMRTRAQHALYKWRTSLSKSGKITEHSTQHHAVELCRARGPFLWTPSTLGPLKHRRWVTRIPYDPESEFDRWLDHIWTKKYALESFLKTNLLLWISQKNKSELLFRQFFTKDSESHFACSHSVSAFLRNDERLSRRQNLQFGCQERWVCHFVTWLYTLSTIVQQTFCISIEFNPIHWITFNLYIIRLGTFWRTFGAHVCPTCLEVGTCCNGVLSTQDTSRNLYARLTLIRLSKALF